MVCVNNYTIEDIAYFAGLFDGEGHIGLTRRNREGYYDSYDVHFQLGNTDKGIFNWIIDKIGGKVYLNQPKGTKVERGDETDYKRNKDTFLWSLDTGSIKPILIDMIPYLKIKKQQAILMLEYLTKKRNFDRRNGRPSWYREWQEGIYKEIRRLNLEGNKEELSVDHIELDNSAQRGIDDAW